MRVSVTKNSFMKIFGEIKKRSKLAFFSLWILIIFYIMAFFAPFFAPYHYDDDDVLYSYAPPTKIHFFNFSKKIFRPYIYGSKFHINENYRRVYLEDKSKVYRIRFFVKGFPYKLLGIFPSRRHLFGVEGEKIFLLGADERGRDLFSRTIYGARISLSIGIVGATISFFIGLLVGGVSGYFGGRVDNIIMRLCEMIMMIPGFYLMLALRASFPVNISSTQVYLLIVVILSFIGWASTARVIRGMSISLREREYVYAARSFGLPHLKIITRHILPHTFSYLIVAIVLSIPGYILGEAALSLIGLGIQEPEASWGNLLSSALGIVNIRLYPWILFPGVFIVVAVICFTILGETLRDIFDPHRLSFS